MVPYKHVYKATLFRRRTMSQILSIYTMIMAYGGSSSSGGGVLGFVPNGAGMTKVTQMNPPYHATIIATSLSTSTSTSTQLYDKKWGPRWNPNPDSEYFKGSSDNKNMYGGRISYSGIRKGMKKFRTRYGNGGIVSVQRLLV